jgi:hypothetical protein
LWFVAGCGNGAARTGGTPAPAGTSGLRPGLVSPGCRKSKVKVAKLYMGKPKAHWPTPTMDLATERQRYEAEFARMAKDFADVDFVANELITAEDQVKALKDKLESADGVLVIHLSMGITPMLKAALAAGRPTALFAAPYSGHEWTGFGALRKAPEGALLECFLTSDPGQLAVAVRPFRAIHHAREAKILDVTTRNVSAYAKQMKDTFGTEIVTLGKDRVLAAYKAVPDAQAEAEGQRWIAGAEKIIEPSRDEVIRSLKLALAFEKLLDEEQATLITVDCYGSMWRQLPAYPCIGHARLNGMGLGGMCESDLRSSMTQVLLQGLSGRPGFVTDPTMDLSVDGIVLAHCMGTPQMDGPGGPAAPYKLRSIMERQEGAVCQVRMRLGQRVTQAQLIGTDQIRYFTGTIIDTPDTPRGCRTKITVQVDGSAEKLWQDWTQGLHRVTVYGDLTADLVRFCRYKGITLVNEA